MEQFYPIIFMFYIEVSCLNIYLVYTEIVIIFRELNNVSFCCLWVFCDSCGCVSKWLLKLH